MKKLNKTHDNLGGILRIWAIPTSDYSINGETVTFHSTNSLVEISCSNENISIEENGVRNKSGVYYQCVIKAFVPSLASETRELLTEMEGRPYAIIFLDASENYKLAGRNGYPLRMIFNYRSGKTTADLPGYELTFKGETLSPAIYIQNPF